MEFWLGFDRVLDRLRTNRRVGTGLPLMITAFQRARKRDLIKALLLIVLTVALTTFVLWLLGP